MPQGRAQTLRCLTDTIYDVVVIGGGITGAGVLRDAASRGLKGLLLEKADFASGTSSKSGKLIHGGLRYLRYGHFKLVYEGCSERSRLMRICAPHIVRPVPFLMAFNRSKPTPKWLLAIGLFIYDFFCMFDNLKNFKYLSTTKIKTLEPLLDIHDAHGSFCYYDCMGLDYRLTIDTIKSSVAMGSAALNYCEVNHIHLGTQNLVQATDLLTGKTLSVRSRVIVNAAGAWSADIAQRAQSVPIPPLAISKGIHLVINNCKLQLRHGVVFSGRDNRDIYLVPWGEMLLLGTTDQFYRADKDKIPVTTADVDYLLEALNSIFPKTDLSRNDIVSAYAGIRPLLGSDRNQNENELSRDFSIFLAPQGFASIVGGKLTTYRHMAKALMDRVCKTFFPKLGRRSRTCTPISGGDILELSEEQERAYCSELGLTVTSLQRLVQYYGSNVTTIFEYIRKDTRLAQPVSGQISLIWAEVDYSVDHEFAVSLDDVMTRRSTLFLFSQDNGLHICESVAQHMGKRLGWSDEHIRLQVESYRQKVHEMRDWIGRKT